MFSIKQGQIEENYRYYETRRRRKVYLFLSSTLKTRNNSNKSFHLAGVSSVPVFISFYMGCPESNRCFDFILRIHGTFT